MHLQTHCFPRASSSVNCSHRGTDNVQRQSNIRAYFRAKGKLLFKFWLSCLCYLPKPKASADNSDLGIVKSWHYAQLNPITAYLLVFSPHLASFFLSIIKLLQYWLFEDLFSSKMFQAAFHLNSVHPKCSFYTFFPLLLSCVNVLKIVIEKEFSMTTVISPYFHRIINGNYLPSQGVFQ